MRKLEKANCQYGAPMGRANRDINNAGPVRMHLQHVPIGAGGYDAGGAYWGLRPSVKRAVVRPDGLTVHIHQCQKIYWYWWNGNRTSSNQKPVVISGFIDAFDREDAKQQVLAQYPEATFYK